MSLMDWLGACVTHSVVGKAAASHLCTAADKYAGSLEIP